MTAAPAPGAHGVGFRMPTHDLFKNFPTERKVVMDIFEQLESEVRGYSRNWPATFVSANGCRQQSADGGEYLDFFSGAGALNYGHNNPKLLRSEEHTSELQSRGHLLC